MRHFRKCAQNGLASKNKKIGHSKHIRIGTGVYGTEPVYTGIQNRMELEFSEIKNFDSDLWAKLLTVRERYSADGREEAWEREKKNDGKC